MEIKRKLKERRKNCIEYIQNHYGFQEKKNNRRDDIAFMKYETYLLFALMKLEDKIYT